MNYPEPPIHRADIHLRTVCGLGITELTITVHAECVTCERCKEREPEADSDAIMQEINNSSRWHGRTVMPEGPAYVICGDCQGSGREAGRFGLSANYCETCRGSGELES